MYKTLALLSVAATIALAACGGGGSDDTQALADAQRVSMLNGRANAESYFQQATISVEADSAVTLACPKGSGFVNATAVSTAYQTAGQVSYGKCPTWATGLPCESVPAPVDLVCNPHLH